LLGLLLLVGGLLLLEVGRLPLVVELKVADALEKRLESAASVV